VTGIRPRASAARLRAAVALAWRARPGILAGYLAAQLVAGALPALTVSLTKMALDRVSARSESGAILAAAAALAAAGFGTSVLPPAVRYLQGELGRSVALLAKDRLYRAVARIDTLDVLETPGFRDRLRLAEQASRGGPADVLDSASATVRSAVALAGMVAVVTSISADVAAVLLCSAVPALIAQIELSRRRAGMAWRVSPAERRELFYTELLTSLSAAKELRLFSAGRLFHRRMLDELFTGNAERHRLDRAELRTQGLLAALSAVLAGGALMWTLLNSARGRLSVGDAGAVIVAMAGLESALAAAVSSVALGYHASLLLDHYLALVATPCDVDSTPEVGRAASEPVHRGIELRDVWFRYGDGLPWVLRGVSVTLPYGHAVALVGENGSGKSTLVKLLCRFYEPTRGSIRWDGTDIRDLPPAALRGRIAAVFQDFMCYELTAAENVAIGDVDGRDALDLSPARITEATRRAGVHDTLAALPRGHDTMLSRTFVDYADAEANGVLLSGGQWQRLALARALLRGHRDLLILDEPSSGLDATAEHELHRLIAEHRRGRTCLLISHRLSASRDADRILVLESGQLVEQGSHHELMAAGGRYARMFRLQASGYQPAAAP